MQESNIFIAYAATIGWALVGIISMTLSLPVIRFFLNSLSMKWLEGESGIPKAVVNAATILAFAIVIGLVITG